MLFLTHFGLDTVLNLIWFVIESLLIINDYLNPNNIEIIPIHQKQSSFFSKKLKNNKVMNTDHWIKSIYKKSHK
jgi:hypothetical protein